MKICTGLEDIKGDYRMKDIRLDNGWQMHQVGQDEWIPATVPGSVYGDLLTAGKMEDPFWKETGSR